MRPHITLLLTCWFTYCLFAGSLNLAPKESYPFIEFSAPGVKCAYPNDSCGESLIWEQKFTILDYKDKNVGCVNIILKKIAIQSRPLLYRINIRTQSDLPFWFFSGKSITDETEYYDEKFVPLYFEFKLDSENEKVNITGKLARDNKKQEKLDLQWKSDNKEKSVRIPLMDNICTAGSIRSIIVMKGVNKKQQYDLQLLDKYKLMYQKVRISGGEITKIANETCYKINLQLGLLGKFSFIVDKDARIIEGKGMGIKLIPVRG